jgi:hypothetical protein
MVDFAELRNRILNGEDDIPEEVKESPVTEEFLRPATGFPIMFGALSVALVVADKLKLEMLKTDEYNYRPIVLSVFGFLPLGFGLGELMRGLSAQKQFTRYENLVEAAESEVARLTEDDDQQETQNNAAESWQAEANYQAQNLAALGIAVPNSTLGTDVGVYSDGIFGQESPTMFRSPSYEASTFGW